MNKTPNKTPDLSLAVQYGEAAPELPRWRIRRWVQRAIAMADTKDIDQVSLTIRLVDKREGRLLNQTYRHKDYATNVLTFEYDPQPCHLGPSGAAKHLISDIVICVPVLREEARQQNKVFMHHAAHLVVHGTLHALGYDHLCPGDAQTMETLEKHILSGWSIADPYNH